MVPEQFRRPLGLVPQGSDATDSVHWASVSCLGAYALKASKTKETKKQQQSNQVVTVVTNEMLVEVDAFSLVVRFFAGSNTNSQELTSKQRLTTSTSFGEKQVYNTV